MISQSPQSLTPFRQPSHSLSFHEGDVLVLFGELFNRGYANGLVEAAEKKGMKVIYSTVGRRDEQNQLRSLNSEEVNQSPHPLVNIPLEAGFDLEASSSGQTPVDLTKSAGLKDWMHFKIDRQQVEESRLKGRKRFTESVQNYILELKKHLPTGKNILFAHLMAGGVPRSKIILSMMNRVFKGRGERCLPSEEYWKSDLGFLTATSFQEVSAETFKILIEQTEDLRIEKQKEGAQISYLAYGYHGTEIIQNNKLYWQSYYPYLQGFAKIQLEQHARNFFTKGVLATVYNCPEILTNSSAIFPGVEIYLYSLFPHLVAVKNPSMDLQQRLQVLKAKLKDQVTSDDFKKLMDHYFNSPILNAFNQFDLWPQHSTREQMELMLQTSEDLISLHKNDKDLITLDLSEFVIKACGDAMLTESRKPAQPVYWLGHDLVLKYFN